LLFSDGVTEAFDEGGQEFGVPRLIESINGSMGSEPTDLLQNCVSSVSGFRGNAVRNDDLTMMALKYMGLPG